MRQIIWLLIMSLSTSCFPNRSVQTNRSTAPTASNVERQVKVTLDVFSGKENPTWLLSEEQADALISVLDALPASVPSSFFDGLGYRGFLVTTTDSESGETSSVTAYKGKIRYSSGEVVKYLTDKGRRVEKLLLESGGARLDPSIHNVVEREIEPPEK
ncbi:MAG: hypothetical protein H0T45_15580 [Pyrinomonadaceae bacterium]|nr:hypothetical protein [Pyrinomonadaceae bacterium]